MHFSHILSTLRRHKTAAALLVLEIALTCGIVSNAVFLIGDRLTRMDRESGVAEDELIDVMLTGIGEKTDADALSLQDLAALKAIPGVKAATVPDMVPFGNSSWNTDVSVKKDDPSGINVAQYMGADLVNTFGLQLIAGRDFNPSEYADFKEALKKPTLINSVILSRAIAEKLFGDVKSAIGKPVYIIGEYPQTVVGVVERFIRPNEPDGPGSEVLSMILPGRMNADQTGHYLLRVDPARREEIRKQVDDVLLKVDPQRIILEKRTFADLRAKFFKQDRAMAYLLVGVSVALLLITALGVVGLASFWVQQRTRQIGIRRALGATKGDIVRYFQTENFILATIGIALGMLLAYAINLWLMSKYAVPRLPAEILPIGALLLWALGQIAVFGPARRAAAIPPAIATRTV